jgi:hypothetical protein
MKGRGRNPKSVKVEVGLRFYPKCGIVTMGVGLPLCFGKVMWRDTGGHAPKKTEWVKI